MLLNDLKGGLKSFKQAGAYASHAVQRAKGTGIFNPTVSKRAAEISMARPDAIEIRKEAGKKGGYNRQAGIAVSPVDRYIWFYNPERLGSGTQVTDPGPAVLCTMNCKTGGDIVKILNHIHPSKMKTITALLDGTRQSSYGWSCKKLDTSLPNK